MPTDTKKTDHLFEAWLAASSVSQLERSELAAFLATVSLEYKAHNLYGMGKALIHLSVWLTELPTEPPGANP